MLSTILDWLGWERLSATKQRHKDIIMKLSELSAQLAAIDSKLTEAGSEIVTLIQQLRDQLGDVDVPADAAATLDAIKAKADTLANIVP